jgi:hypothetical protein
VSESGYFAWSRRAPSDRELTDAWLTERIRRIHAASGGRYYGARQMVRSLCVANVWCFEVVAHGVRGAAV